MSEANLGVDPLHEAEDKYIRAKLQEFLSRNPEADIRADGREFSVSRPWGEEAIEIPLRGEGDELFEVLNAVRLPPRFTAIWHDDKQEFEVIFTVLRKENHLQERSFEFWYRERCYRCGFEPSSSRLRIIARNARFAASLSGVSLSGSDFRNLQPFNLYEHMAEEHPGIDYVISGQPTSFWIRGIDNYDEDHIVDLVRNLNFHMFYYDRYTPVILVHEESVESRSTNDDDWPDSHSFPSSLSGRNIDQHLLVLWASAQEGDSFLRFIQYYQILEYAGFYHVKDKIQRDVERAMAAPDAFSRPDRVAQQIVDAISADKRSDADKINEMIEECVDLEEMWKVLQGSLDVFSEEVELDGGFVLPALVSAAAGYEEFVQSWNKQFSFALHRIRNALVHARESRQSTTIAPTTANHARLSPWLLPLSRTAARVMLYSRL